MLDINVATPLLVGAPPNTAPRNDPANDGVAMPAPPVAENSPRSPLTSSREARREMSAVFNQQLWQEMGYGGAAAKKGAGFDFARIAPSRVSDAQLSQVVEDFSTNYGRGIYLLKQMFAPADKTAALSASFTPEKMARQVTSFALSFYAASETFGAQGDTAASRARFAEIAGGAAQSGLAAAGVSVEITRVSQLVAQQLGFSQNSGASGYAQLQAVALSVSEDWRAVVAAAGRRNYDSEGNYVDPLVLDLNGDGIDLKRIEAGAKFDLRGDGNAANCGFVQGDDARLFLDADGDGVCADGKELFGDQQGHANGFEKLREYDENGDGVIDERDAIYEQLRVWQDRDGDGVSVAAETQSLRAANVKFIRLNYESVKEENGGNIVSERGVFGTFDGEERAAVDAQFRYQPNSHIIDSGSMSTPTCRRS
ncbi:hypothetical protein FACS1894107_16270 [Planctomycetales bacterium]|nr:hypothetical protein FACS1894107_16270 [Planctomycetales bacterium]GHS99939.1 hypothetical protein FACS1894108_10900 [Planctomycetales bacterium]